jgi:hypothetical protein
LHWAVQQHAAFHDVGDALIEPLHPRTSAPLSVRAAVPENERGRPRCADALS